MAAIDEIVAGYESLRPGQEAFYQAAMTGMATLMATHRNRWQGLPARKSPGPLIAVAVPPGHDSARATQKG